MICLGVWLNAADSLVTATLMPSVGSELGGYSFFSWATAGFFVGSIVAGASTGRLSERLGLKTATTYASLFFAAGSLLSALAPNITLFLVGRLVQGAGSGWISGFAMIAITRLFPDQYLPRVFAAVAGIWGVATVLGPLLAGVFAEHGWWRGVFWLFALQSLALAAAALVLLENDAASAAGGEIPWAQLGLLVLAVAAIALSGLTFNLSLAVPIALLGLALLAGLLRFDRTARVRLLPVGAAALDTVTGAGYACMFALTAATMGLTIYGPVFLQQLHELSPLWAGYAVAAEAALWSLAAFVVAETQAEHAPRWIRAGALCMVAGVALLSGTLGPGPVTLIVVAAAIMGCASGFYSALLNRRVIATLSEGDRNVGSAALISVRQTGSAVGAALCGVLANVFGVSAHSDQGAAFWVAASGLPLALLGAWAAFRLTREN